MQRRLARYGNSVSKSSFVLDISLLGHDEWLTLRDIRLSALRESPDAFLSTYDREQAYDETRWRAEFARGDWNIGWCAGRPVSLLGVTREPATPGSERYLEYLWVSPEYRRSNVAVRVLMVALEQSRTSGVQTVFLWVLDGNDAAVRLYKRIGFVSTNFRQPLPEQPWRSEEKMRMDLSLYSGGRQLLPGHPAGTPASAQPMMALPPRFTIG